MVSRWISAVAAGLAIVLWVPAAPGQTGGGAYPSGQGAGFTSGPTTLPPGPPSGPTTLPGGPNLYTPTNNFGQWPPAPSGSSGLPADLHGPADACPPSTRPEFFTPFMLGDLVFPVGSYFFDLKVAEGNSPRPVDRVFLDFNYYNDLGKTSVANPLLREVDLYRYVFGFEKTFLDGKASVEVRVPFFTLDAMSRDFAPDAGFTSTSLGNISATGKFVLWEDKATGSLISTGAVVSLPTESSRVVDPGPDTLAFIEAFMGFILSQGDFYCQGFTSLIVPLARPESIVLFEDLGVGYFVYRDATGLIRSVAPTVEMHITVPLKQADPSVSDFGLFDTTHVSDIVDFTLGGTIEFSNRSTLGLGVCVPVTGPKPWDVEAIAQFNYRF
jgi:hypothetical protein